MYHTRLEYSIIISLLKHFHFTSKRPPLPMETSYMRPNGLGANSFAMNQPIIEGSYSMIMAEDINQESSQSANLSPYHCSDQPLYEEVDKLTRQECDQEDSQRGEEEPVPDSGDYAEPHDALKDQFSTPLKITRSDYSM